MRDGQGVPWSYLKYSDEYRHLIFLPKEHSFPRRKPHWPLGVASTSLEFSKTLGSWESNPISQTLTWEDEDRYMSAKHTGCGACHAWVLIPTLSPRSLLNVGTFIFLELLFFIS